MSFAAGHWSPETLEAHLAADVAAIALEDARAELARIMRGEGNEHGYTARAAGELKAARRRFVLSSRSSVG
jgi:hypothetical protein